MPELLHVRGVEYRWGSDEYDILRSMEPDKRISIGDKLLLITSHCDPTVNLYDHCYPVRNGSDLDLDDRRARLFAAKMPWFPLQRN